MNRGLSVFLPSVHSQVQSTLQTTDRQKSLFLRLIMIKPELHPDWSTAATTGPKYGVTPYSSCPASAPLAPPRLTRSNGIRCHDGRLTTSVATCSKRSGGLLGPTASAQPRTDATAGQQTPSETTDQVVASQLHLMGLRTK